MQKKTELYFRWAGIFLLASIVLDFLEPVLYEIYLSIVYPHYSFYNFSYLEALGGWEGLIKYTLPATFLLVGLFSKKRWALVTGLSLRLLILWIYLFESMQFFAEALSDQHYYSDAYNLASDIIFYLYPIAQFLLLGVFCVLLMARLFRQRPFSPKLSSITLLLPVANFVAFSLSTLHSRYISLMLAFLDSILDTIPLLLLAAALIPPRPQGTESDHAIARCGLWTLAAGFVLSIILTVISTVFLDGVTYTEYLSPLKIAWWLVSFLMILGGITAPRILRYWPKT